MNDFVIEFGHECDPVFRFLSNFYHSEFIDDDLHLRWPTVEHYYQAMKATNPIDRQTVWISKTPGAAKRAGRLITCRVDWEDVKEEVMLRALRMKFALGGNLAKRLIMTSGYSLVEKAPWDEYWGTGKTGKGLNRLGFLLEQVRNEIT